MDLLAAGKQVLKTLNEAGYEAYFVGGMVRDQLLNRPIYDVDITTSAHPEVVMSLFEKTIGTGIAHGTVTVMINKTPIEVTTFRVETGYTDYRHPNEVIFTASLEEDLKRRDFTINAIARDINGCLFDPMGGLDHLKARLLQCVGKPTKRFTEDPLRMLRGIRFVSKLGFLLEKQTLGAIQQVSPLLAHISKERIKKELEGLVQGEFRQEAMDYLFKTHLLELVPDLNLLHDYQDYNFKHVTDPILLFVLVSLKLENPKLYLSSWPFSKEEKRCISVLYSAIQNPIPLPYFTYRYGEEWAKRYHQLNCFLKQVNEPYESPLLRVNNRKELDIDVATITKLINRPKGPWIQQLLEMIEYQVVMQQLENKREVIIQFIKGVSYE